MASEILICAHFQQGHSNSCSKLIQLNLHQEGNHFSVSNNRIQGFADRKREGVAAEFSEGWEEQLLQTIHQDFELETEAGTLIHNHTAT